MTVAYPNMVANGMSACTVLLMSRVTTSLICPRRLTVLSGYVDRVGSVSGGKYITNRKRVFSPYRYYTQNDCRRSPVMSDKTSPRKDDGTSTSTAIMGSKIVFWELRNKVSMNVDTQARMAPV